MVLVREELSVKTSGHEALLIEHRETGYEVEKLRAQLAEIEASRVVEMGEREKLKMELVSTQKLYGSLKVSFAGETIKY